jgi:hypothetical protein
MTGHTDRQAPPIRQFGSLNQKAAKFCNVYARHDRAHRQAGVASSPKIRLSYSKAAKFVISSVVDPDPGSGAFLTLGSGIRDG